MISKPLARDLLVRTFQLCHVDAFLRQFPDTHKFASHTLFSDFVDFINALEIPNDPE